MENKNNNIVEIITHSDFVIAEEKSESINNIKQDTKSTNPIAKSFAKFALRSKDKFSLKDILR